MLGPNGQEAVREAFQFLGEFENPDRVARVHSQLIQLKSSCFIDGYRADPTRAFGGRICDDGTKAGGAAVATLRALPLRHLRQSRRGNPPTNPANDRLFLWLGFFWPITEITVTQESHDTAKAALRAKDAAALQAAVVRDITDAPLKRYEQERGGT